MISPTKNKGYLQPLFAYQHSHISVSNVPTFLFSNKIFVSSHTILIMTQQQLKRAIALNNKAVSNLSHCSKKHIAYDFLKRAHQMIRRTMLKQSTSSKSDNDRRLRDMGCVCHGSFPLHFTKDNLRDGYIYNQLLTIDIDQLPSTPESAAELSLAIVVLNLALVYHNESLTFQTKGSIELAVNLYNHAIKVLGHADNKGTAGLIRIAALNNLTQLRYELGNFLLARESLQHLALMVSSGSSSVDRRRAPVVDDEVKKGMIMNILSLSNQHVAPAA
jgi:hypothetical protein